MALRAVQSFQKSDRVAAVSLAGVARAHVPVAAATKTLTAADSNALVEILKADGVAITLPALSAVAPGSEYVFKVGIALTADATITAAGSDVIAGVVATSADGAAANSDTNATVITFDQSASAVVGQSVKLIAGQALWYVEALSPVAVGITLA